MDKKALRKHIIQKRLSLSDAERSYASKTVFQLLISLESVTQATTVSSFVTFGAEIQTDAINHWLLEHKKRLVLPYISPVEKKMTFHEVHTLEELVLNDFGILEPVPTLHTEVAISEIDCVITPGVAFDNQGYRLGYGGGFYDRFFSLIEKTIPKIGIAFDCQLVESLPVASYDMPINLLITEKGIHHF